MDIIYFTLIAVLLYAVSDWLLNRIEIWWGSRFPNRSLVFLVIIMTLSMTTFSLLQHYLAGRGADTTAATQAPLHSDQPSP